MQCVCGGKETKACKLLENQDACRPCESIGDWALRIEMDGKKKDTPLMRAIKAHGPDEGEEDDDMFDGFA